jgi:polysaccharide export outer membrane protein
MRCVGLLRSVGGAAGLTAWLAVALACATGPVPAEFQDEAIKAEVFRIQAADILTIRVWKNPELSVEAPVLPDGTLSVPLAGAIPAAGLTTEELEDVLAAKYEEYIAAPAVSVTVAQVNSQRVSVVGEVIRQGWVNLYTDTRVVEALSTAGGFTPFANRRKVKIIRRLEGREIDYTFNYEAFVRGDAPGTNVRLQPGDTVIVSD